MAFSGKLLGIYVTNRKAAELQPVEQVGAIAGAGLRGDRYFQSDRSDSKPGDPEQEVTLIESEAIEAVEREYDIKLTPQQTRRNLLTKDVPLNQLVFREFRVGEVVLRGLRLCEPCGHLESLTCKGLRKALIHRGGLRAEVIRGGEIKTGDVITPVG